MDESGGMTRGACRGCVRLCGCGVCAVWVRGERWRRAAKPQPGTATTLNFPSEPSKGGPEKGKWIVFAHESTTRVQGPARESAQAVRLRPGCSGCLSNNSMVAHHYNFSLTHDTSWLRTTTTFLPTACQLFRPHRHIADCLSARMLPQTSRPPANPSTPAALPTACQLVRS